MDELHIFMKSHLYLRNGIFNIHFLNNDCTIVHNCGNSNHFKKIAPNFIFEVWVLVQTIYRDCT